MAFFQDARPPKAPFLNAPAMLLGLIGLILMLHAARVFAPDPWPDTLLWRYAFIPARLLGPVLTPDGVLPDGLIDRGLPFVTYIFLHGGWEHVAVNSLWLLAFGAPVARRLGNIGFLSFFLVCGVAAAATHLALNWGSTGPVVGASGSISGITAAAIRIVYGQRERAMRAAAGLPISSYILAPVFSRQVLIFTGLWVLANAVVGFTGLGTSSTLEAVAWEAHLGGYFSGLLLIGAFDRAFVRAGV